jgi:SAM-dependent MidA family methyltransferase
LKTPLAEKIAALIRNSGPISVTDYFALCLADPQYGYYKTRDPFGRGGDFVTAPEISQLFGEMVGIFLIHAWQRHLKPKAPLRIVEIGPGRGTMMADILRVVARLAPEFYDAASVHMVETSPHLRRLQAETLAQHGDRVSWHGGFDEIPDGFVFLVANEFFDAVPFRQFVKTPSGFRERMVGLDADGNLAFSVGAGSLDTTLLPRNHGAVPMGSVFEIAPARAAIMQSIAERLFVRGGTALIFDYGHLEPGFGDTLQAIWQHRFDPPLARPGEADLTSHVDFSALSTIATACQIHVNGLLTQGAFLTGLGIGERAAALAAGKNKALVDAIQSAVDRLAGTGAGQMGELFKVMAVSSPGLGLAPFDL